MDEYRSKLSKRLRAVLMENKRSVLTGLKTLIIVYSCLSLVGCATVGLVKKAEERAVYEEVTWEIQSIAFAAIRNQRFVRMCMGVSSDDRRAVAEVFIDLDEISPDMERQVGSIDAKTGVCARELLEDESKLHVGEISAQGVSLEEALQQFSEDSIAQTDIALLRHETGNYLLLRAYGAEVDGQGRLAYRQFNEHIEHADKTLYFALPVTIAVDMVVIYGIAGLLVLCVFLPPICLPLKALGD